MASNPPCPGCGGPLPAGMTAGSCPRCRAGETVAAAAPTAAHAPGPAPNPGPKSARAVDLDGFRGAVLGLGLVPGDELDRREGAAQGDPAALARALVSARLLTAYQAKALLQGRGRGLAIGPYLVLDKRGEGGMGMVFKARRRDGGPDVALKILRPSFSRDREAVRRFRREFEVAARLDHPNVVAALDASEDRGVQYLTMEYVEGIDLDAAVRDLGPLPVRMSVHCAIQAAQGLAAAHALGIIHRDVKPANLMLDPSGAVRVLDLGLARVIEAASPLGGVAGATLTQTGSYMGTVDYIAPEQADDSKRADHRADIYSLGCTLYFLLAGRPPFDGDTLLKRLIAHQGQPPPSLFAARDDIPPALEAAYQAMMAKRPGDRPVSMAEVVARLEACRSSPDEARQADAGLRSFAETIVKRAAPRKRGWGVDASVFARPGAAPGLRVDPDLKLEDLITDFREEVPAPPPDEARLPPIAPRPAAPRRRSPRPRASGPVQAFLAGVVLLLGVYLFVPRPAAVPAGATKAGALPAAEPGPEPAAPAPPPPERPVPAPEPVAVAPAKPASATPFAESLGIRIVPIPPGEFLMGITPEQADIDLRKNPKRKQALLAEMRQHRVKITRLRGIAAHEVTIGQFRRFVEDTGYRTTVEQNGKGGTSYDHITWKQQTDPRFTWQGPRLGLPEDHPVSCVSWDDAVEFCRWLARKEGLPYRLPTEAEWEYCCRAGTTTLYFNGDDAERLVEIANVGDASKLRKLPRTGGIAANDGFISTAPVGRFLPNAWGIHDMHGNVWEWCQDFYDFDYYGSSPEADPEGPASGRQRLVRGGSWFDDGPACRSASRNPIRPDYAGGNIGFRVALAAPGPQGP